MLVRSEFSIVKITEKFIIIKDIGTDCISVTNDAENVVEELFRQGLLGNKKLFYYDSQNDFSELRHDNGKFLGFLVANSENYR